MAYGTKYYFEAPGLREAVYRLDLEKEGHTGGTQQITRDMASLSFEAGKEGLDFDASIQPSRAEIRLREQSIIQEVYGSPDRLWRATAHKKPPGGSYEQYFRGFVLGDMGRFDPGNFRAPFTLEAVDGLELLKNVARPRDGNTDKVSAFLLIQEALEEIEIGLDWALQWPWFYRLDNTTDSELVDGDEKLKTLYTWEDAHKIERSRPEGDGKLRDHYNILRRLLQTLNLRLVQSQGQWWVRQRHVGRYGAETTHHYTPGTDAVQNTTQEDLVWDLSAKSSRVEERPSRYRRNLGRYTVVHDFGPYTGRGLPESGLETLNNWTLTTPDPTEYDSIHESHNNIPVTPDETANNQKAVLGLPIYSAYPYFSPYLESDRFSFPSSTRRDEVLRLSFRHACEIRQEDFVQAVQLEHNGWWLQHKDSKIAEKVTRGEGVTVPLQNPLKAPIPKGTTLRVFSVDRSQQYPLDQTTELTLTETARTDDNALVGDLQDTIKPGDYTSGNPGIRYYTWQQSQTRAWFNHMYQEDNYATRELVTFMQDPSGTVVNGDDMKLWFAMLNRDNVNNDYFLDYGMVVDDISIELTVGDSVVSQAEHDTFTNAVQAQEKEQSTYLGDGPSADSKARLFYHDPSTGNSQHSLNEFGLDSWDSNTYQGLRLPHLRGREYLRELRTKHERYTLRVHVNDPSDVFGPHHILLWEGDLWSIEHYSHTPDNGYIDVEVMPLQDDGIAGLSYTSILTTGEEDSGGGSISSSQSAGGTGPSPVNQWQNIGGGVGDGLFVNSSGVLGVELDSDSFLNFDSNGILQAEVKDEDDMASDSADHLATQQSIKAYVDASNVTVDFAQDGSIDIDPLSKISTKGDANSIFQSGAGTGELLFDVSQKWPNADQLDGYEGSALAALAENETITGSWAHDNALTLNAGSVVKGGATGTDHFASKTTGWEVDYGGAADFRSIYADELVVQAFTADITQTLVGSQLITKSRARLASTFTVPASGDPPNTLHVEDIPQISGRVFTVGDTVRLRLVSRDGGGLTVADVWGTVDNYNSLNDGTQEWDFTTIDANGEAGASINEGSVALDYGQSGGIQGQIYSTVNDGSGAPYTDYRTWTDSGTDGKPDSFNIKARVGELDGIANANATGGGIYTSQGRFEEDVIIGDLSTSGAYVQASNGTLLISDNVLIGNVDASQIRKGGTVFQAGLESQGADWDDSSDFPLSIVSSTWSGDYAGSFASQVPTSSAASGGQPGAHTKIPEEIALEFAGRTVEVTVWAKEGYADKFAVSYSTNDVGNSGWQEFSPTSNWESYRFTYDVPEPGSGGPDYLGINGDADGLQDATTIDRVTVRPQTQRVSGFEITSKRIERYDGSGTLDVAIGRDLQNVDGANRALFGEYGGDSVMKVVGGGGKSTDYVLANGVSGGTMFEVASGGNTIIKVEDSGNSSPAVFIDNLSLKDLTIEGTLTMGTSGEIINSSSPSDYRLDEDGFTMRAGSGLLARRINWEENGTEIARIAADNGTMESKVNGDEASGNSGFAWYAKQSSSSSDRTNRIKMGLDYRPDGEDSMEFLLTDTDGYYTTGVPEFRIGQMGTDPRGWSFYPNEGFQSYTDARGSTPSNSDVKDVVDQGDLVLYAHEEGDGTIVLMYAEYRNDGTVNQGVMARAS